MTQGYALRDLGTERALVVDGVEHRTYYSERVIRLLIERKGARRAPLYFPFKETRGRHFLERLFAYLARSGVAPARVLEVGCSFGHITEYVAEQPLVTAVSTFDVDPQFARITRVKVAELGLDRVREVRWLSDEETRRLPWPDGAFDVVLVVGVVEHLPWRERHRYVDEYYRVLAPGGHIAVLDTPNRLFPLETHTVGLPLVQWLPLPIAWRYARALRTVHRTVPLADFAASAWRNATVAQCLPSRGRHTLVDVTEDAGYGWRFFADTARSRLAVTALRPLARALAAAGWPPTLVLPYINMVFRRRDAERAR